MAATLSPPVAEAADEPRTIYIALPQVQTRRGYLVFKRCFDFTFALLALIVLAVPMGIIAAIIALDSPGGPIYRQERRLFQPAGRHAGPDRLRAGQRRLRARTRGKDRI